MSVLLKYKLRSEVDTECSSDGYCEALLSLPKVLEVMVRLEALPMFHLHWTRSLDWREELGTGLGWKLSLVTGSVLVCMVTQVQEGPHVSVNV